MNQSRVITEISEVKCIGKLKYFLPESSEAGFLDQYLNREWKVIGYDSDYGFLLQRTHKLNEDIIHILELIKRFIERKASYKELESEVINSKSLMSLCTEEFNRNVLLYSDLKVIHLRISVSNSINKINDNDSFRKELSGLFNKYLYDNY